MAILDDLKGILSPEDYAKLEGNAGLKTKLDKANELYSYYAGEEEPAAAAAAAANEPEKKVATTAASSNPFDLGAVERMLDAREKKQREFITSELDRTVKERGDELVNNAVKISLQRADELNRIYIEHQANYSEAFDSVKFNEYLEANKARGFRTIREAYDTYVGPRATEREVDKRVTVRMAEKSGQNVPGTSPGPSSNKTIEIFKGRGKAADAGATTGAQRAAALLDRMAQTA